MPFGWECNTKYTVAKFEGKADRPLEVGNPRAPHPLYETLMCICSQISTQANIMCRLLKEA